MPKVSVIIPSYNNANLISETVESVLNQTFDDYEIIIIDGSTDNTKDILSKYGKKIAYFYLKPRGVSAARNLGIAKAKGKYIAFLDADDLWFPKHLEITLATLEGKPEVSLAYSKLQVLKNNETMGFKPAKPALTGTDFWLGASITTSTVIVKKECFNKAGLFDEDLMIAEDADMWIRIVNAGFKIHYISQVLGIYRLDNPGSLTKNSLKMHQSGILFHKRYFTGMKAGVPSSLIRKGLAREYYFLGKLYLNQKQYPDAAKNISKAIITKPYFGADFISKKDSFLSICFKIIKPYLALCYCGYRAPFSARRDSRT